MPRTINILGATGSIGQSTADVIASDPGAFSVRVVSAHRNAEALEAVSKRLKASDAILTGGGYDELYDALSEPVDITVAAMMGIAGLKPLMKAIEHSKVVAIANKEPLVAAGPQVIEHARKHGTTLLPLDSEHNAIFQVFDQNQRAHIERIILTASGGPFRTWNKREIEAAAPEQALKHPNWSMGKKITIDSATLMNKALEVIEAHYLFNIPAEKIDVVVHPQSVIHSLVEYADGSMLAQLGANDMRTPISYALAWPERMKTPGERLDLVGLSTLEFEEPDHERFPALKLAYECLNAGQAACIILNAANEEVVDGFLTHQIQFGDMMRCIVHVLDVMGAEPISSIDDVIDLNERARTTAKEFISEQHNKTRQKTVSEV